MKITGIEFVKSATRPSNCPDEGLPEIAFVGRSNVGKSSLINTLVNRRSLVRTSSTPGRTQLLNFFRINNTFMLVDLPGYGYAKAPVEMKREWGAMMRTYLETRDELRGVIYILDIRRVPSGEDLEMLDWLEEFGVPTIPVITKIDKISRNQRSKEIKKITTATGLPADAFSYFSSLNKEGVKELWERIEDAILAEDDDEEGTPSED